MNISRRGRRIRPVGEIYKYNENLDDSEELTPSLQLVIEKSLGKDVPSRFGDAEYVMKITLFTEPLKQFILKIFESLEKPIVTPLPLIKGFGFGKTHSLIVIWHLFTDNSTLNHLPSDIKSMLRGINFSEVFTQTLIFGCDASVEDQPPLFSFVNQLKAYASLELLGRLKDPQLVFTLIDVLKSYDEQELAYNPSKLIELFTYYARKCKSAGKIPRFIFLIDELGLGIVRRVDKYLRSRDSRLLDEIVDLINFLPTIAEEFKKLGIPIVIIYALADQDIKSLEARADYSSDEKIRRKLEGLIKLIEVDLRERLKRYTGGVDITPLHPNPEHNIEIAKFRVLKILEEDTNKVLLENISYFEELYRHLSIFPDETELQTHLFLFKKYFPLTPALVNFLLKVQNPLEVPATEYVRTVIYILKEAAKTALKLYPYSPAIGLRFLNLRQAALCDFMSDVSTDWWNIVSDIFSSLEKYSNNREVAEAIAKIIVAKGSTANILPLIKLDEESIKYGTSLTEIQAEIASTVS